MLAGFEYDVNSVALKLWDDYLKADTANILKEVAKDFPEQDFNLFMDLFLMMKIKGTGSF